MTANESDRITTNEEPDETEDRPDRTEAEPPDSSGNQVRKRQSDRREVVVPESLYRIVTVFSTLIAIVAVVGGFVLLDTATNRTLASASEVNVPIAILGIGAIVLGAAVYAFASRFRTQGMGRANNDTDEQ